MDFAEESKRYEDALDHSFSTLRGFLATHAHASWKLVPSADGALESRPLALINGIGLPATTSVHRRSTKRGDVVRATSDVLIADEVDLEAFAAVLQTPEVRSQWDPLVEKAAVLDSLDAQTQLVKTDFKLGWPVNPRDAVTISRTLSDDTTVLHVATSLPRLPNEPSFLRPSPPYVRADVGLFAWRLQIRSSEEGKLLRIHLFWQWALKGAVMTSHYSQVAGIVRSFVDYVRRKGIHLPILAGYGLECDVTTCSHHTDRNDTHIEYRILLDSGPPLHPRKRHEGLEELAAIKEARRLERTMEIHLPASEGWDIQIACQGQGAEVDSSYAVALEKAAGPLGSYATLRITHAQLSSNEQIVKAKLSISHLVGGSLCRVNGETTPFTVVEPRDPSVAYKRMLEDAATAANVSLESQDAVSSGTEVETSERPAPADAVKTKAVAALIRRCYNYFTSLLQEPEQKWRPLSEAKGVAISQLTSPDPTLAIYRAEATFVGIGIWDLYATLVIPGTRQTWDVTNDSVVLLDDLGESSALWHIVTKAIWPSWARDAVLVQTSYRSPNCIHVFAFSTDDEELFTAVPKVRPQTIRGQVDVQGWCIEALSPTTVRLSLIEQSDAKGWSMKSWLPQHMSTVVASLGEYTIRHGGPPMITRQLDSKIMVLRYEQDKGTLRAEYLPRRGKGKEAAISPTSLAVDTDAISLHEPPDKNEAIECEVRCNIDLWAADIDLIVDPRPSKISCLNRHRLSAEGGGLWITLEHAAISLADNERVTVLVRKGAASREQGGVTINGKRQKVEVERLAEDTVKSLAAKKRIRAIPVPLDKAYKAVETASGEVTPTAGRPSTAESSVTATPEVTHDLLHSRDSHAPISPALEALAALQAFHAEEAHAPGQVGHNWSNTTTPHNYRRVYPMLNPVHAIYRADKVIEKASAEHLVSLLTNATTRPAWDERVASMQLLESFGMGISLSCMTTRAAFLAFRPRIFFVGSASAVIQLPSTSSSSSTSNVYFVAMASFQPDGSFSVKDINPQVMPMGNVVIDGWILESLDPYASDQHPIPSTRCSYFTSIDYAGAMPTSFSSMLNVNPLKIIDSLERFVRANMLPRWIAPPVVVEAVGSLSREGHTARTKGRPNIFVWQLKESKEAVVLLAHDYSLSTKTFSSTLCASLRHTSAKKATPADASSSTAPGRPQINGRSSTPELRKQASITALRSTAIKHKISASLSLNSRSEKPGALNDQDLVLGDMLLYPQAKASKFIVETTATFAAHEAMPFSLAFKRDSDVLAESVPIRGKVWPVPLDAVNSSSLSPTGSAPSHLRPHLLRLFVPISESVRTLQDPLREGAVAQPVWLKRLKIDRLLVRIKVVAHETKSDDAEDALTLILNNETLQCILDDDATPRKVVNGSNEEESRPIWAQLSRVIAKPKDLADQPIIMPKSLSRSKAVTAFRLGETSAPTAKAGAAAQASEARGSTGVLNATAPIHKSATPSPQPAKAVNGALPIISTAVKDPSAPEVPAISALVTSLTSLDVSNIAKGSFFAERRFSVGALCLVAMFAFLCGSILRALVGPADYVLDLGQVRGAAVDDRLIQALQLGRHWRPAHRLLEFRIPRLFIGRRVDLMCAAVGDQP